MRRITEMRTFSSLGNGTFRLYFVGMAGQWASMNMGMLARSYVVYVISDSGTVLGLAALANAIPMIFVSLWGGAIADRVHKKYILLYGMIASGIISAGVGVCLSLGYLSESIPNSWWILIVASVFQGAIMGAMMPARQAIIAEIVEPDQLMNAISLNMMGMNTFRILAPAASGFLMEFFGFADIYYIMAGMYLFAGVCMHLMPRTAKKLSEGTDAWKDIIDGFRYIVKKKTMLHILIFTLVSMICGMPFMQLMPMITTNILHVGAGGLGILMSVSGAGAIVGSLILASSPDKKRGLIMLVSGLIMALGLIGFGFSSWMWLSLIMVVLVGLGQAGNRGAGNTLVLADPPYDDPASPGAIDSSLGTFFAGVLAQAAGIQWSIGGFAIVFAVVSVGYIMFSPRLRNLD